MFKLKKHETRCMDEKFFELKIIEKCTFLHDFNKNYIFASSYGFLQVEEYINRCPTATVSDGNAYAWCDDVWMTYDNEETVAGKVSVSSPGVNENL